MRYRQLVDGDMSFGQGVANFLVNSPACVAQAVQTRLLLLLGEFFLDVTDGTPYATEILAKATAGTRDEAIRDRILGTPNVTEIESYSSVVEGRSFRVQATINTAFGRVDLGAVL